MDALDRLAAPATDLLDRVDDTLAHSGAPDDHPIWPLLRQVRALPGDAVGAVVALQPETLAGARSGLRRALAEYTEVHATLPAELGWTGAGAERFAAQWAALGAHLGGADDDGLTGRLATTLSYVDAVEDWIARGRSELAGTLAEVLTSAEAVHVWTAGDRAALAAADLGAHVLACVAELCERGDQLAAQWAGRLGELPYRPPAPTSAGGLDSTTVVPA